MKRGMKARTMPLKMISRTHLTMNQGPYDRYADGGDSAVPVASVATAMSAADLLLDRRLGLWSVPSWDRPR